MKNKNKNITCIDCSNNNNNNNNSYQFKVGESIIMHYMKEHTDIIYNYIYSNDIKLFYNLTIDLFKRNKK